MHVHVISLMRHRFSVFIIRPVCKKDFSYSWGVNSKITSLEWVSKDELKVATKSVRLKLLTFKWPNWMVNYLHQEKKNSMEQKVLENRNSILKTFFSGLLKMFPFITCKKPQRPLSVPLQWLGPAVCLCPTAIAVQTLISVTFSQTQVDDKPFPGGILEKNNILVFQEIYSRLMQFLSIKVKR